MARHPEMTDSAVRHLYCKARWSLRAIGKHFGCSHVTVLHRLERMGVARRDQFEAWDVRREGHHV